MEMDDEKRRSVGQAARREVLKNHTGRARARELVSAIEAIAARAKGGHPKSQRLNTTRGEYDAAKEQKPER
jgi:spore maturation protein CgeB